jgi:hypothetical protein
VAVGRHTGRVGADGAPFVLAGRLGAHDKLHRRPQLRFADLGDVVAFLAQRGRDGPGVAHRDVHEDHPDAEILHIGEHSREIFLRAHDERVADRPVTRQGGQVAMDLALDSRAPPVPRPAQPQLHAGQVGQGFVFSCPTALHRGLVPVTPQQRQAAAIASHVPENLEDTGIVPGNGITVAGTVDRHRAIP